ncbi:RING-CH-type domain-containing protein [Haematococcus lacustris]|uniref:RING-CH-type domain-containing protein n=1 Tax=Haematococcus lacustris TaxID=44745 RepID=A0A699ZFL7_HAELA|nr:RING-CH-type domain-containing protein [Haematococcus lacustris]
MADSEDNSQICWVCHEPANGTVAQALIAPCDCPRLVHAHCLARWQLQSAGKDEELNCRFCHKASCGRVALLAVGKGCDVGW